MVANSKVSQTSEKQPISKTSPVRVDEIVTPVDAAEFLRSALAYVQQAGIQVMAETRGNLLVLAIPGFTLVDGQVAAREEIVRRLS